jgi:hypothetical protein
MGTQLREIYDLFMMKITDYRLIDLFTTSELDFENYLQAWLIFSIHDFSVCDQSLLYDEVTNEFYVVLTQQNKVMLSSLMVKHWMEKSVQDITQFQLHITDRDFKMASEAQNLREKAAWLNIIKEECSQMLIDYGYKRVEWADWYNQDFSGL